MLKDILNKQKTIRCSNEKGYSVIRNLNTALKKPYIQANPLNSYEWIIIDCDYNLPYYKDLPIQPNIIVLNKDNNKGHLYFKISSVHNNPNSSYKAIEYYHAVRYALTILLKGDLSYTQTLSKNPLATNYWRVINIHNKEYELRELAEYCDLVPRYKIKELKHEARAEITGRNCAIFWTAKDLAKGMTNLNDILNICINLNNFKEPLSNKEVLGIAKSIYRYNNKPKTIANKEKFIEKQKERNKKSQSVRKAKAQKIKDKAFILFANKNLTQQAIADRLGVSLRTIKKISAEFKKAQPTKTDSQHNNNNLKNYEYYKNRKFTEIDKYLCDTFSLYAEEENTEKIPINTINRLLE